MSATNLKTAAVVTNGLSASSILFGAAGGQSDGAPQPIRLDAVSAAVVDALSAADILALVKTVDGVGSGLDADLLDGNSSAHFATAADLSAHLSDTADAHDASAISVADVGGNYAATDVEAALAEVYDALEAHIADATAAHAASAVSFSPAGGVAASTVQAAIEELDTEKQPIDADLTAIAALSPSNDDIIQRKGGAWVNRTMAQLATDLDSSFLTPAEGNAAYQPLDADLTSIAGLSTTAAGRSVLTAADPNADRLVGWKDSDGAIKPLALADIADEAAPASGDKLVIYGAEGDIRKIDWDDLPGAGGGISEVVEDTSPQLGGNLDANGSNIDFDDATGIRDDSGNEQLIFQKTATAVNHLEITNAASGNHPALGAAGDGTDINIDLLPKGTGTLRRGTKTVLDQGRGATLDAAFGVAATSVNDGTKSSGTFTPAFADGNVRRYLNNGAHTLAPPTGEGTMVIQITNDSGAGAITTSGFTKKTGDAFTTTNGHDFLCNIQVVNGFSLLHVTALQ